MKKFFAVLISALVLMSCAVFASAECAHEYNPTVYPPDCNNQGYTEYVCNLCGNRIQEGFVPANGHMYGEWELVSEATCTSTGLEKRVCRVCGGVATNTLAMLDHIDADADHFCDHCDFEFEVEDDGGLSPYEWLKLFFANILAWFKAIFA